jgi:ABC-type uncharacterized transport system permease subunit
VIKQILFSKSIPEANFLAGCFKKSISLKFSNREKILNDLRGILIIIKIETLRMRILLQTNING